MHINVDDFPTNANDFNHHFAATSSKGVIVIKFYLLSSHTFWDLKMTNMAILKQHNNWFQLLPNEKLTRVSISQMGFWCNVHSSFANPQVYRYEICETWYKNIKKHPNMILKQLDTNKNDSTEPDLYISPTKMQGTHNNNN